MLHGVALLQRRGSFCDEAGGATCMKCDNCDVARVVSTKAATARIATPAHRAKGKAAHPLQRGDGTSARRMSGFQA